MTKGSTLQGKKILIFQQRDWGRRIGHFLAKKLQAEGARLAALTLKKESHRFLMNQKEIAYDMVINIDEVMQDPAKFLSGDDISFAQICDDLGADTLWPLIYSLRNHVKSYGEKYYYAFQQNVSDEEIVLYTKAIYRCLKRVFVEFKPDIILSPNLGDLSHLMCNVMADKYGAVVLVPSESKVRGIYVFTHNYRESRSRFCERIDALNSGKADSENRQQARKYIQEFRTKFIKPEYMDKLDAKVPWRKKLRQYLSPLRRIANWYLKEQINYIPNLGITIDWRPPRIILRDFFGMLKYKRFANTFPYYPFEKLDKFVYFPLQFQPEQTIDVQAPYFANQIEAVRLVAMSLPGDYTLAVKEHPAMVGYRAPSYLEKLARTANVKLIDYRIPSEQVIKNTDLIVSPSSTSIAEAAFYNKPAVQLGDLGTTLKLPNVFKHSDMPSLARKIREVLQIDLQTPEYERRLENYVAAAYDVGFEFNYRGVWERGEQENMEPLWEIYRAELETI